MKKLGIAIFAVGALAITLAPGMSQPPDEKDKGPKMDKKGPPGYELGNILPPFVRDELELTEAQEKAIADLEKMVRAKLLKILTAKQVERLKNMKGPKGPPKDKDQDAPPEKKKRDESVSDGTPISRQRPASSACVSRLPLIVNVQSSCGSERNKS